MKLAPTPRQLQPATRRRPAAPRRARAEAKPRETVITPKGPKRRTVFGEEDDDLDEEGNVLDVDAVVRDATLQKQTAPDPFVARTPKAVRDRKGRVLAQILRAGTDIQQVLTRHAGEIDDTLVAMLERRLDTAKRYGEDPAYVRLMETVLQRLLQTLDKKNETAAERLLDTCLQTLVRLADSGEPNAEAAAIEEIQQLLRGAFFPGLTNVDIFEVAELLAQGGQGADVGALAGVEHVEKGAFLREGRAILAFAEGELQKLEDGLRAHAAGEVPEWAEELVEEKAAAIGLLQGVLEIAEGTEL